ncbi:MAG: hypothetical protein ABIR52_09110 [Casimicrobiaceae bacterium]
MPGPKNPDSFEFEKVSLDEARQVLDDAVRPAVVVSRSTAGAMERRKAGAGSGAETLRTATLQWILKLPQHVQPRHLQLRYPRIANRLAAEWEHVVVCETFLESLLTDKRGGRKGFPLAVAQEIAGLRDYYFRIHHKKLTPWDHVEAGR